MLNININVHVCIYVFLRMDPLLNNILSLCNHCRIVLILYNYYAYKYYKYKHMTVIKKLQTKCFYLNNKNKAGFLNNILSYSCNYD